MRSWYQIQKPLHEWLCVGAARFELATSWSQTRRDNRATLRPEYVLNCGGGGIRTRGTELPVRQFSKLLISATHPPHRLKPIVSGRAKLLKTPQSPKDLCP